MRVTWLGLLVDICIVQADMTLTLSKLKVKDTGR